MERQSIPSLVLILIISFSQISKGQAPPRVPPHVSQETPLLANLRNYAENDLTKNILPWWSIKMVDKVNGGFFGRIDSNDKVWPEADKGGILNARILWTWSASYRILKDTSYLRLAKRSRDYIYRHFLDTVNGGAFISVKANGQPSDTRKQTYTLSFFIYALAEYSRATGDREALKKAKDIYRCIEKYASDTVSGGYYEVFTRDWKRSHDRLIGEKNDSIEKTMNTHLHLLEAYTNLYRIWPDKTLRERLINLVNIFETKIVDSKTSHLIPFMLRDWTPASVSYSFGHEIECSWLLDETAKVLGDQEIKARISVLSLKIADAAAEGLRNDGSMATEKDLKSGEVTSLRSWWEQAETIVGYLNAWQLTPKIKYLGEAMACSKYITEHFVDKKNGGWYSYVDQSGIPGRADKAGFWVCPYHNGRMCLEVIERTEKFTKH